MKVRLGIIAMFLILVLSPAYALDPVPPGIYLWIAPKTQNVASGGSAEFQITPVFLDTWIRGEVSFELMDPPEGVTATFDPDAVEFPDEAQVIMTVKVAADKPEGNIVLNVDVSGRECCWQGNGKDVGTSESVELNVIHVPPGNKESEQVVTVTVTVTSVSFRSVSTTTVVSSVVSTVTDVITTRTLTIGTSTSVEQLSQVSDLAFPVVMLGVVVVLLSVAFVALRRKS